MVLTDEKFRLSPAGLVRVRQSIKTLQPVDELKRGPFMLRVQVVEYRQIDTGMEVDVCLSATSHTSCPVWESVLTLLSKNRLHKARRCLPGKENESQPDDPVPENVKQVEFRVPSTIDLQHMLAEGHTQDVCDTCHPNATCDYKTDGPGKVCNCKYGFVGNGRTFCQDKNECQIGASKICGQHTNCHNTYGSYYCTCLDGYSPSNNMSSFIPNDGTHCQDTDECRITGLCGDGGQCRNLDGSFECSCQLGYKVHNGVDPFHPHRDKASCKVVDCGQPASVEDMVLLSVSGNTYSSVATFSCDEGFVWRSGDNTSVCGADGLWTALTMVCEAKCGPVPFIANSVVMWHNRSIVIHRCLDGYHSWRGSNVSVCGSSGLWQKATLRCIEIKPPISHLFVLNEKCLRWKAEKYEDDTEVYRVTYIGSRDFQRSFHDKRKRFLSSKAQQLELCLNLLPVTNYSISITAVSTRFTATITTNTSLPVPPAPVVYYREFETPVPTLGLRRSPNPLDPISLYQVFVLPVEGIMMFDCSSPASSNPTSKLSLTEYITAQIDVTHVGTEMNFTVGDALYYGGVFNAPLENGRNYYIILRAVNQWKMVGFKKFLCPVG
ncbi:Sushi domain-containing protein 1 [Collichthys lucidus]|uniref:Sushi domain-containing protein 1 n=1 Tax=Collichthys lucidus TaxID=240159 RepID=A0A4U5US80_COLLU|nr:Sushi domain-containing protein 1 [Collichthys lucidus]